MKTKFRVCLFAVVVVMALSGCISSAPIEARKEGGIFEVRGHSMTLERTVRLTRQNVAANDTGFVQAQVEAVNLTRRDVQFQYRFRWLDRNRMVIDSGGSMWKPVSLAAYSTAFLSSTAPAAGSSDFFMEVRFVHDTTRY